MFLDALNVGIAGFYHVAQHFVLCHVIQVVDSLYHFLVCGVRFIAHILQGTFFL